MVQAPITAPAAGEVQIAIEAFSLNFGDLLCVSGLYPTMPAYPFTPGFEVSGTVRALGAGVSGLAVGDAVIALMGVNLGGHASLVNCDAALVFHKPASLTFEQACALPSVALTMIDAFRRARLQPGERVLIQTATGGTGLIAVQLAKAQGAQIIATAGSAQKLDYLRGLGVTELINYREQDFEAEVLRMTQGQGVDVVINTLGGDALQKGMNCLAPGGRYIEIAMTALKSARTVDLSVLSNNQTFHSVDLRKLGMRNPALLAEYRRELLQLADAGVIAPTISAVLPLERIREAYQLLQDRRTIGKVVVAVTAAYRVQDGARGTAPQAAGVRTREPIAVIGMSGRYGAARNLDSLWQALAEGRSLVLPVTRWDLSQIYPEQNDDTALRAALLSDIDEFDPLVFNISGTEATYMDPQQRLFLQEAWTALEDAGYVGSAVEGQSFGVYVGSGGGDYANVFEGAPAQAFWGNADSVIPARLSYYLNLQGPAVTVDTACSSSLVATHLACQGLWTGEIRMALTGGVFVNCTPAFFVASARAGMLSPTGRCYTFDDRADGFVTGEGVGAVVLKRLADALADGDHVHGVIRASGINQDGTTHGITAPSAVSQERLERQVYDDFGIDPETIQLVEAHGTGTKLGDPIEFRALTAAFRRSTQRSGYCALGSIKTNIGHAAAAAGVASLLKVLLALRHKQMPPSLNFERGNSHIDFAGSPFFVNTALRRWDAPAGQPRRAAISSFGFSGTNAHLVIDEAPARLRRARPRPAYLMALSARSPEQLRQQAQQLHDWLDGNSADAGDISHTLLLGRRHFVCRLACVVGDTAQLRQRLAGWLQRGDSAGLHLSDPEGTPHSAGEAPDLAGSEHLPAAALRERLEAAAQHFAKDGRVDFAPLFAAGDCSRIPLPTYPFARERYWAPPRAAAAVPVEVFASEESSGAEEQFRASAQSGSAASWQTPPAEAAAPVQDESRIPLLFQESWQPAAVEGGARTAGKLLCLLSDPRQQAVLRATLAELSPALEVVFLARGEAPDSAALRVADDRLDDYAAALEQLRQQHSRFDGVWYLWPLEQPELVRDYAPIVLLVQALAMTQLGAARLLLVSECHDGLEHCYAESWIALERSLKMVLAQTRPAVIIGAAEGVGALDMARWSRQLWQEQHALKPESAWYTAQGRQVLRVQPYAPAATPGALRHGGTYLITGGLGGIGLVFARHLARTYAAKLILIGRSALDETRQAHLRELEAAGGQVMYLPCDVGDVMALGAALGQARERFGAIHGVLHSAGIDGEKHLLSKRVDEFEAVIAPKVAGTLALDAALEHDALDFVCHFSSASAVLGDFGSCDYALGNRFQMAHAVYAQRQRQSDSSRPKTLAILWPLWRDGGMRLEADETTHLYLKSSGQRAFEADEGVAVLEQLLGVDAPHVLVMTGNRERICGYLGVKAPAAVPAPPRAAAAVATGARRSELAGLDLPQCVAWDLAELAAKLLRLPRARLSAQENLADFGFDSLSLAEFAERLSAHFGLPVTPSLFFKYGTLGKLAGFFVQTHAAALQSFYGSADSAAARPAATAPARARPVQAQRESAPAAAASPDRAEPIAIVGLSGRFPQARSVDELWQILSEGRDAVTEIPAERFDWRDYYDSASGPQATTSNSKWLGALPGVAEFDPAFFEISPREAALMDPRQRLLLQEAYKALEDAGYGDAQLQRQRVGMFVGVEQGDYEQLLRDAGSLIGSNDAILAARLSYALNLRGPAMAINTACSSGLVAAHQAVLSLRAGECDAAVAAGVSVTLTPGSFVGMTQAGMLSPTGRCRAFDRAADGMVPGEAIVALVFKRLSQAQRDGDVIHALVRASGINYDGKTNGITAPNGGAQAELIQAVLAQAQLPATAIEYIVSHGTGTRLGDPVEINALSEVFPVREAPYCALTSTKSNLGHTFAASGLVSLVSLVLALRHETIPASLHCTQPSDYVDWARSPFYVNTANRAWPRREQPRFGALSSFGISGTNAHMIVQSWDEVAPAAVPAAPCLALCLSARSEEALRRRVEDLLAQLRGQAVDNATLWAISYTLWCARQHHAHRVAVVVRDAAQATALLQAWLAGDAGPNVLRGKVARDFSGQAAMRLFGEELLGRLPTLSDAAACQQALQGLAELYCQGYALDWAQAYGAQPPRRVALPTYPFARETYWLPASVGKPLRRAAAAAAADTADGDDADYAEAEALHDGETGDSAAPAANAADAAALRRLLDFGALRQRMDAAVQERAGVVAQAADLFEDLGRRSHDMEQALAKLLFAQVLRSGLFADAAIRIDAELPKVDALYHRWLEETARILVRYGYLAADGEGFRIARAIDPAAAWAEWDAARPVWFADADLAAQAQLVEAMLRNLPEILKGTLPSTDIMFQGASMTKVEGVYKDNLGADYFNAVVADVVVAYLQERLATAAANGVPMQPLRLLEIGAGTGGTSAMVLARLQPYHAHIAEYCYTDISRAFLSHAKNTFGAANPFLNYQLFNVEKDPSGQGLDIGAYDLAIATNVLHATSNIRNTLRSAKAMLGAAGVLVINEMAGGGNLFTHLTFGLMKGWWLFEDAELRVPGSPGVLPETWQRVLGEEGYAPVEFPAQAALKLGQQVIVARSDGLQLVDGEWREPARPAAAPAAAASGSGGKPRRAALKGLNTRQCLEAELREQISELLLLPLEKLDPDENLADIGFDSISLMGFAQRLTQYYGVPVTPALFFSHTTQARLVNWYMSEHGAAIEAFYRDKDTAAKATAARPARTAAVRRPAAADADAATAGAAIAGDAIAVIGMSGRFPQARTVDELWEILRDGRNAVEEIPAERWDWRSFAGSGPAASGIAGRWLGAVPGVAEFDPLFFEIAPREAELMDPRQRLLLQEAYKALEDAAYGAPALRADRVGIFVGVEQGDYQGLVAERGTLTANHEGILAARLAYVLNLRGPAMAINTACSSGLVAAHQACLSLRADECDAAIAAGVNLMLTPQNYIAMSQAGMLSPDGRCYAFDRRANGMVPAEAVVALVFKRLSRAQADGNRIYAVIEASGLNYDGKTNGITAPSGVAQTELIRGIHRRYGIAARSVQYVVTHGTGTRLGDPIEINALNDAFKDGGSDTGYCAITSTKSNLGHSFAASGLVNLVSLVQALRHAQIPASLHADQASDYIEWARSPFFVNQSLRDWPPGHGGPRRGAVSAFGMSGTNVHMIVREYTAPAVPAAAPAPVLLVLSARTETALQQRAADLAQALAGRSWDASGMAAVSYTLLCGRQHFAHRAALVASDAEHAQELLRRFNGAAPTPNLFRGKVAREFAAQKALAHYAEDLLGKAAGLAGDGEAYHELLGALADVYCQGYALDWARLFGAARPLPVSLPGYPFARERIWIEPSPAAAVAAPAASAPQLHPLLHSNASTLAGQRYSARFSGEEFFLRDHVIQGRRLLPGVACLEMARAAVADALGPDDTGAAASLVLKNVVWSRPLAVDDAPVAVEVDVEATDDAVSFAIYSQAAGGAAVLHAQGLAQAVPAASAAPLDLAAVAARCGTVFDAAACYASFGAAGIAFGPALRGLQRVAVGNGEALADVALPDSVAAGAGRFVLHPSLLDSCLQAAVGLELAAARDGATPQASLPFALESVEVLAPLPAQLRVHLREAAVADARLRRLDFDICAPDGQLCLRLRGFSSRVAVAEAAAELLLLQPRWRALPAAAGPADRRVVLLCGWEAGMAAALRAALADTRCLVLQPGGDLAADYTAAAAALLELLRELAAERGQGVTVLQVVVPAGQAHFAGLAAMLKTAQMEHAHLAGQLIQLAPGEPAELARQLAQSPAGAAELRHRDGAWQWRGWEAAADAAAAGLPWKTGGVYLLSGGAGGLGLLLAREIASRAEGVHLVLAGRSELGDAQRRALDELRTLAASVDYRRVDLADAAAVEALVAATVQAHGAVHGVLHIAGVVQDNYLVRKTRQELDAVFAPKVQGLVNLDAATRHQPLDLFVLFSSVAGALGNAGQADYAAANAFMDTFARERAAQVAAGTRQGRSLSVNWPLWADGGMVIDEATQTLLRSRFGLQALDRARGLEAFYRALAGTAEQVLVLYGTLGRVRQGLTAELPPQAAAPAPATASAPAAGTVDAAALAAAVADELLQEISQMLKVKRSDLDVDAELSEYGFDSINLTGLANRLNARFELALMPTVFFEYPTVRGLAGHLAGTSAARFAHLVAGAAAAAGATPALADTTPLPALETFAAEPAPFATARQAGRRRAAPAVASAPAPVASAPAAADPIVVIGMSGRFPQADDLAAFWDNLVQGRDCIEEIPPSRWDWRAFDGDPTREANKTNSRWGGFISGVDEFDPLFFGISPREAVLMDPQQRLLMQFAWAAIEDAGYAPSQLSGSQTGIFVGTADSGYSSLSAYAQAGIEGYSSTGSVPSVGPNRTSFFLNLHGPSEPVETACSSSLVAIHRAVLAIQSGSCDLALAGGVQTIITPTLHISFSKAGMLSGDGRCKTFSDKADGYVRGEGVGMLLLKKRSAAEADRDPIRGVILAAAENHGGRANSLTAPNPKAQAELLKSAYRRAGIDPRTVGYIEAHGTGTELGDPVEVNALKAAFAALYAETPGAAPQPGQTALGTVKSNIGHLELAAGVAGVIKLLLQLKHRTLVRSLHCERLNPYIDFAGSPFDVVRSRRDWPAPRDAAGNPLPRRGGVSSFGFGGANAHVVLEEYPAAAPTPRGSEPVLVVLSAKNAERLRAQAQTLAAALAAGRYDEADLADIAYTLQVGRDAMDERLAFVAASLAALCDTLQAFARDGAADGVLSARVRRSKDSLAGESAAGVEAALAARDSQALLNAWVHGAEVAWARWHGAVLPRRISLPSYAFARTRYWVLPTVPPAGRAVPAAAAAAAPAAAPVVDMAPAAVAAGAAASAPGPAPAVSVTAVPVPAAAPRVPVPAAAPAMSAAPAAPVAGAAASTGGQPATAAVAAGEARAKPRGIALGPAAAAAAPADAGAPAARVTLNPLSTAPLQGRLPPAVRVAAPAAATAMPQPAAVASAAAPFAAAAGDTGGDSAGEADLAAFIAGEMARRGVQPETGRPAPRKAAAAATTAAPAQVSAPVLVAGAAPAAVAVAPSGARASAVPPTAPAGAQRAAAGSGEALVLRLRGSLSRVLGLDAASIDVAEKFSDVGLDSIAASEWVRLVNAEFGVEVKATKVYDHPTLEDFAAYLQSQLGAVVPAADAVVPSAGAAAGTPAPVAAAATVMAAAPAVDALRPRLLASLSRVLGLGEDQIGTGEKFSDVGLDSIAASEWVRLVNAEFGIEVKATKVYDHPTLEDFAVYLQTQLAAAVREAMPAAVPVAAVAPSAATAAVAVATIAAASSAPVAGGYPAVAAVPAVAELLPRLLASLSRVLGLGEDQIGTGEKFSDVGLDSIAASEWVRLVNAEFGVEVKATKVYDHPTLEDFAAYLQTQLTAAVPVAAVAPSAATAAVAVATIAAASSAPVAGGYPAVAAVPAVAELLPRLLASLSRVLGLGEDQIGTGEKFSDVGLDSIAASEWVRLVNAEFGVDVKATKVYDHPTLEDFAAYLQTQLAAAAPAAGAAAMTTATPVPAAPSVAPAVPAWVAAPSAAPVAGGHAAITAAASLDAVLPRLQDSLSRVLALPVDLIGVADKFSDVGLDSIAASEWIRLVNIEFGVDVKATKVYDHPTLEDFAAYLQTQLAAAPAAGAAATTRTVPVAAVAPSVASAAAAAAPVVPAAGSAAAAASVPAVDALLPRLQDSLSRVLALPADLIGVAEKFSDVGLDSIAASEWIRLVNVEFGTDIKATKVYDHPTLEDFAAHLHGQLGAMAPVAAMQPAAPVLAAVSPVPVAAAAAPSVAAAPRSNPAAVAAAVAAPVRTAAAPAQAAAPAVPALEAAAVFAGPVTAAQLMPQLTAALCRVLGLVHDSFDPSEKFSDIGLESVTVVEWIGLVNQQFGLEIAATKLYDHPTLQQFADFLAERLNAAPRAAVPAPAAASAAPAAAAPPAAAPAAAPADEAPVVELSEIAPYVAQIRMQDRESKNGSTAEVVAGLQQAFAAIDADSHFKVVILTGYDSYFATGGTRQGLVAIQEGEFTYDQTDFYRLPIDCKLPVIAAMQGHGIGAGWVMGMACDFPVLSRDSYYSTNFMMFGFTPGVGSTLILPHRFGPNVAQELLFTGKRYRGSELAEKGVSCPVVPRTEVMAYAIALARDLANSPREALMQLKRHMAEGLRSQLADTVRKELAMHQKTFVDQPEVRERIERHFGGDEAAAAAPAAVPVTPAAPRTIALPPLAASAAAPVAARQGVAEGIAVVGLSVRFPKARNSEAFWRNIESGRNCIEEVPATRWAWRDFLGSGADPERTAARWGAFIDGISEFDPLFFGISPKDAQQLPAQQRLLLTQIWEALEDAAITPAQLAARPTGVFLAIGPDDASEANMAALVPSMLPNRISYALDLRGPSEYCESGCASVAVALHRAAQAIRSGECEQALVAAVHLLSPASYDGIDETGFLSVDGVPRPFQADANGYVRSEGAGAVVLRPLAQAIADNDLIYGVIRGTAVLHGGGSMSLSTPTTLGMKTAMQQAFRASGFGPDSVSYVEAHGTASMLSDAIEANALIAVYGEQAPADAAPVQLSSLKSSIGHCEIASGLASLAKVLLALRHRVIPGIPRFGQVNQEIELKGSRFVLGADNRPWTPLRDAAGRPLPRRAAINSYGYTGVNGHLLVEEYLAPASERTLSVQPEIVLLSARSAERLAEVARRLLAFVQQIEDGTPALADIAYTLQRGRVALEHRLALIVASAAELQLGLRDFLAAAPSAVPSYQGVAESRRGTRNSAAVQAALAARDQAALAQLWAQGAQVDWAPLQAGRDLRRLHLPTYPFPRLELPPPRPRAPGTLAPMSPPASVPVQARPGESVRDCIRRILAEQLNVDPGVIRPRETFRYYGADSYTLVALQRGLEQAFGVSLLMRQIVENMNLEGLAGLVEAALRAAPAGTAAEAEANPAAPAAAAAEGDYCDPAVIAALEQLEQGEAGLDDLSALLARLAADQARS
nr:SDR family NAD(P)-dependent oxidoreductase [Tahibacter harae]